MFAINGFILAIFISKSDKMIQPFKLRKEIVSYVILGSRFY